MPNPHQKEIETVRKWERKLLLHVLEEDSISYEEESPATNHKSQILLRTAFHIFDTLLPVAYHDPMPDATRYTAFHAAMRKDLYHRFIMAVEANNDFFTARKIMIQAIRELNIEQGYDLHFLLQFRMSDVWDDSLFIVSETPIEYNYPDQDNTAQREKGDPHEQCQ